MIGSKRFRIRMGTAAGVACIFGIAACASQNPPAVEAEAQPTVVARFADQQITEAELDAELKPEFIKLQMDHLKSIYNAKQNLLTYLINSRLVEQEATRQGMEPQAYMQAEVFEPAQNVSEEEVRKLYDDMGDRINAPYDDIHDKLVDYRKRMKEAELRDALIARLRKEANLEITLAYPDLPVVDIPGGANGPSLGPVDARVTIVEFSDFECPYCSRMAEPVRELLDEYPGQVRLVYRHFPLEMHPQAFAAAEASACAEEQGRFWEYHDLIFANQQDLSAERFSEIASSAGVDADEFTTCMEEGRYRDRVGADRAAGFQAGVQGTPSFFVNGRPAFGVDVDILRKMVERELNRDQS